jgi:hypothetical protein
MRSEKGETISICFHELRTPARKESEKGLNITIPQIKLFGLIHVLVHGVASIINLLEEPKHWNGFSTWKLNKSNFLSKMSLVMKVWVWYPDNVVIYFSFLSNTFKLFRAMLKKMRFSLRVEQLAI